MSETTRANEPVMNPPTDIRLDPDHLGDRDAALTSDPEQQTEDAEMDGNPGEGGAG